MTPAPLEHISLNPAYREAYGFVQHINDGALLLDPPYQRGSVTPKIAMLISESASH